VLLLLLLVLLSPFTFLLPLQMFAKASLRCAMCREGW
jgi:hypothetical protein